MQPKFKNKNRQEKRSQCNAALHPSVRLGQVGVTSSVGVAIYVWAWPSMCGRGHCGSRRCSSQRLAGVRVVDAGVNPALVTLDVGDDDGLRLHEAVVLRDDPAQQPFTVIETRGHAAPVKLQERGKQFINPQLIASGKQFINPQLIDSRS